MSQDKDYLALARAAVELEEAQRIKQAVTDRAAQMQHADERAAAHKRLCEQHGLPLSSTPRQVADAEIAYVQKWRSFVTCRYSGSATAASILSPESAPEAMRADFQARQDRLRAEFERSYAIDVTGRAPDARVAKLQALADRPGTPGEGAAAEAAIGRITGVAA